MKTVFCPSLPFQRLCKAGGVKISIFKESNYADPSVLMLFHSCELTVILDDGQEWKGVLKQANTDLIQIGEDTYERDEWYNWFLQCELGMITGLDFDLNILKITDAASYGIDPASEHHISLSAINANKLRESIARDSECQEYNHTHDYPILYSKSGENEICIFCVGNPVSKVFFGRIQIYIPDLGAGTIAPVRDGYLCKSEKLRFIAEDLVNALPGDISTASTLYDVSYTVDSCQGQLTKAKNVFVLYSSSNSPESPTIPGLETIAELCRQSGAAVEIFDLPSLPDGREYGLIYYFKPEFNAFKVSNLFKSKFLSTWTVVQIGKEIYERFSIPEDLALLDDEIRNVNTIENVYLVSYAPNGDAREISIVEAFQRQNLWMLRLEGGQMLKVQNAMTLPVKRIPDPEMDITQIAAMLEKSELNVQVRNLEPLKEGIYYGFLHYYLPEKKLVKIINLYKNRHLVKPEISNLLGQAEEVFLPNDLLQSVHEPGGDAINTQFRVYLVSFSPNSQHYSISILCTYDKIDTCALMVRGNKLLILSNKTTASPAIHIPDPEMDITQIAAMLEQSELNVQVRNLEPLEEGFNYGFLHYYKPEYSFVKIIDLFKNIYLMKPETSNLLGEAKEVYLPNDLLQPIQEPGGDAINTQYRVYLVSYYPNSQHYSITILSTYEKIDTCALMVQGNKLLILSNKAAASPVIQFPGEYKSIELPALPNDGSQYALVTIYARSYPFLYFYRATSKQATGDQYREWTLARVVPGTVQFYNNEDTDSVTPDAAFNTLKYAYIVRVKPESDVSGSGVPTIRNAVYTIREFAHAQYNHIAINGNTVYVYGYAGEGIVKTGLAPAQQTWPPFVKGETLLISDGLNIRVDSCPGDSYQQGNNVTVYRFGVLSSLLRDSESQAIVGGYINGITYFSMDNVNDQTKNNILTSKKRVLLIYTYRDAHIQVDRVLPKDIVGVPWKKGTVASCDNAADALSIDVEVQDEADNAHTVRHFQSTGTDGYVSNAARNGNLKGESVFLKEILCPDFSDEEVSLVHRAAFLHCEQEKAIVQYSEIQDAYYACRYNLKTGVLGTIRVPIYGTDSALKAVKGSQADISFMPDPENDHKLIAYLQGEDPHELSKARATNAPIRKPDVQSVAAHDSRKGVENTPIGRLILNRALKRDLYLRWDAYLRSSDCRHNDENGDDACPLDNVFYSERSDDNIIAAALLAAKPMRVKEYFANNGDVKNHHTLSSNAFLRRAFRGLIIDALNRGDYQIGELSAFLLPILESDSTDLQRARDLYVYLLPCFNERWKIPEQIRNTIIRKLYDKENREEEQEYIKDLNHMLEDQMNLSDGESRERAFRLVQQLIALDTTTLSYFRDNFADRLPSNLVNAMRNELGIYDKSWEGTDADIVDLFESLEERHHKLRRKVDRFADILREKPEQYGSICAAIQEIGRYNDTSDSFEGDLNPNDRENFQDLVGICNDVLSVYTLEPAPRLKKLKSISGRMDELQRKIAEHPTQIVVDILYGSERDIWKNISMEITEAEREICDDSETKPAIKCFCNEEYLRPGQGNFTLNLVNGELGDQMRREIQDIVIRFEVIDGLSADDIQSTIRPSFRFISSGELRSVNVEIMADLEEGDEINIACTIEYDYFAYPEYDEDSRRYYHHMERSSYTQELVLCVSSIIEKLPESRNPYSEWYDGKTMDISTKMFFGRETEMKEALSYLQDQDNHTLNSGRILVIYGQKRCGKSSFVKRLENELRKRPETIIVSYWNAIYEELDMFSPEDMRDFRLKFYSDLLKRLLNAFHNHGFQMEEFAMKYEYKIREIENSRLSYKEKLIEKAQLFQDMMDDFRHYFGDESRIVLIVDEFTRLCHRINSNTANSITDLEFVRYFQETWGFVQILVGHNSMMQYLEDLNLINRTVGTSHPMFLSGLGEEAAKDLINKPMMECRQYDPFKSDSGTMAMRSLMEWSGCFPNYLLLLCNYLFEHFRSSVNQLIDEPMAGAMLKELFNNDGAIRYRFDPILCEDVDDSDTRKDINKYLEYLAIRTPDNQEHQCTQDIICDNIGKLKSYRIRDILIKRGVLEKKEGMIKIKVGLYREYIKYLNRQ